MSTHQTTPPAWVPQRSFAELGARVAHARYVVHLPRLAPSIRRSRYIVRQMRERVINGAALVGSSERRGGATFQARDAATGETFGPEFRECDGDDVADAARLADAAHVSFANSRPADRAAFLESIGAQIVALGDRAAGTRGPRNRAAAGPTRRRSGDARSDSWPSWPSGCAKGISSTPLWTVRCLVAFRRRDRTFAGETSPSGLWRSSEPRISRWPFRWREATPRLRSPPAVR